MGGGEIFHNRPDRPWDLYNLMCSWYQVSSPEVKRPGRFIDDVPPSCAGLKKSRAITLLILGAFIVYFRVNFTLPILLSGPVSHLLFSWYWWITTRGIKRPGRESQPSPPPSVEVKSYTPSLPSKYLLRCV